MQVGKIEQLTTDVPADKERRFVLRDEFHFKMLADCISWIKTDPAVWEVIVRPHEKLRSTIANSRHWATLTDYLKQITQSIEKISTQTGYTPLEIKRLIAKEMPPEHIAILFARSPETAHDVLKEICGIPTSTRLGTKKFHEFDETMEQTIAEIMGQVNAFEARAG